MNLGRGLWTMCDSVMSVSNRSCTILCFPDESHPDPWQSCCTLTWNNRDFISVSIKFDTVILNHYSKAHTFESTVRYVTSSCRRNNSGIAYTSCNLSATENKSRVIKCRPIVDGASRWWVISSIFHITGFPLYKCEYFCECKLTWNDLRSGVIARTPKIQCGPRPTTRRLLCRH